ncbi:MAG TPA: TraR/DksA family transcriptional regulator [Longimicrobiales bacterium]|nr:TraR/DksA family transcriptional regulator [Longimicrobiales bacterium]
MNDKQRAHLEQRLLQERERAVKALRQMESEDKADGDLTTYPFHLADEGTDTIEQEQDFLLRSVEGRRLYEIDDALRTLYKEPERYGKCQSCAQEIALERLDLVPWARLCLDCQTIEESKPVEAA